MRTKIDIAMEFLKDGLFFTVDDVNLSVKGANSFIVIGWSQYSILTNITKQISLRELEETKVFFSEMLESSEDLRNFVSNKSIEYKLNYDDAGKSDIEICSEKNAVSKWILDFENLK